MLAEFIDRIAKLAREGSDAQFITCPQPRKTALRVGTTVQIEDLPPPLRDHTFDSLDDLLGYAADPVASVAPEVFYYFRTNQAVQEAAVILVPDKNKRLEQLRLPIAFSDQWAKVSEMAWKPAPIDVATLIREIRFRLNGTGAENLLPAIRRVEFKRDTAGHADLKHGRESLGRSVEAVVQGINDIPERIVLSVRPFDTQGLFGISCNIDVGIHIDVANERFLMQPLAGEVAMAARDVQDQMRERIEASIDVEAGIAIYQGKPSFPDVRGV